MPYDQWQPQQMGTLRLTMPGSFWTSSMVAPTVLLDGYRLNVTSSSGSFDFPVPQGSHRLHAHGQWLRRFGNADIDFSIQPGQFVEIFYAPPVHQFANRGAIGFTPQKRQGVGILIAFLVSVLALFGFAMVAPFLF